ncbi:DUF1906 domain-containing protein [bacterium]|nr:DUF1906 domain-containing protein [bacterium]
MKKQFTKIKGSLIILTLFALISLSGIAASPNSVSSTTPSIQDFQFVSPGKGWVLIDKNLFWTSDWGAKWENISPAINNTQTAYFLDEYIGFSVAVSMDVVGNLNYTLFHTNDGGNRWNSYLIKSYPQSNPLAASFPIQLYFLDQETGWLAIKQQSSSNFNIGALLKTSDGGKTWQQMSLPLGEKVMFINESVGFTAGGLNGDHLYRTGDGGSSWQVFDPSPDGIAKIGMPGFSSSEDGMLVVLDKSNTILIFETEDQGKTWTETASYQITGEPDILTSLALADQALIATASELTNFSKQSKQFSSTASSLDGIITQLDGNNPENIFGISTKTICTEPGNGASCEIYQDLIYSADLGQTWRVLPAPIVQQEIQLDSAFSFDSQTLVLDYPRTSLLSAQGFDICEIPNLAKLDNWKNSSPYAAVNLYIGGLTRACDNTNLSIDFVEALSKQGWKFIPTWVGHQASCTNFSNIMSSGTALAENQGRDNAIDAARVARKLGLGAEDDSGTVIYYDLEAFDSSNLQCLNAAKAFINGWVTELHAHGIMAGLYGSTGGSALQEFASIENPPDVIWPAIWNGYEYDSNVSVFGLSYLSDSLWSQQDRIRQYAGAHNEYWGGIGLNIDSNVIYGVVADISDYVGVPTSTLANTSFETGTLSPWEINQTGSDCSWAIANTIDARTGNYVLEMSKLASQVNCSGVSQTVSLDPVVGDTYRFAIWARSSSPINMRSVRLFLNGEGGTPESSSQKYSGIDDSWHCLEVSHTIQSTNLTNLSTEVVLENADGIDVMFDDAHLSLNTDSLCPTIPFPSDVDASNAREIDQITINWDLVPDTTYYRIYRSDTKNGTLSYIGLSTTNSFADHDGDFLDVYFYWVRACNAGNCSPLSAYDAGSFSTPFLKFSDTFEKGDLARWFNTYTDRSIFACTSNPISGAYSLCGAANTSSAAFVEHYLANPTNRITLEFKFDPNNADLSTRTYTILKTIDNQETVFQLKVIYLAPNYIAALQWYIDGVTYSSPQITIPNAPTTYRIEWSASLYQARSTSPNGKLQLFINNIERFSTQNIDSSLYIDRLLFGIIPNTSSNEGSGTIMLDDIQYFGPQYIR